MLHQEGWFSFHVKSGSGKLFEQQVRLINWHFTNHHYLSSVLVLFVWVPVLGAIINTSCSSTGISCPCTIHTCLLSKKKICIHVCTTSQRVQNWFFLRKKREGTSPYFAFINESKSLQQASRNKKVTKKITKQKQVNENWLYEL